MNHGRPGLIARSHHHLIDVDMARTGGDPRDAVGDVVGREGSHAVVHLRGRALVGPGLALSDEQAATTMVPASSSVSPRFPTAKD